MNKQLYNAPPSPGSRRILGQGCFVFGLSMIAFGIYLFVDGFNWPLGGRERTIDIILMMIFGPQYASLAMVWFFIGLGIVVGYKGLKMWCKDA
ncbi:hypothetical protein [Herbaspirillum sp. ST 5-3]|uniref:hypothetical protein n=1 Tax=Oxalobacteraceae TaxID=75682 RepID=UPI0010A404AB|nr:hypothetical protein [Herbaspirillum sp. ST 5-3]